MKIQSLVLAAALSLSGSAAMAQQSYWGPAPSIFGNGPYARSGVPVARQACARWCPSDLNPCDPPEFKVADGRCNGDRGDRR